MPINRPRIHSDRYLHIDFDLEHSLPQLTRRVAATGRRA
jgi:hypothetical protein